VSQLPKSRWWIKSDGCDVVSGLMESTTNVWNGDVDYGDGAVQKHHREYVERLEVVDSLSGCNQSSLIPNLQSLYMPVVEDVKFVDSG